MAKPRRMSVINRVGERYGRLTVVSRAENHVEPSGATRARWNCICDCGGTITSIGRSLSQGLARSCGCEMSERRTIHGMHNTRIYRIWSTMRQRCSNPKSTHFASYGGRGIRVCKEWDESFDAFYRDVGAPPLRMTLDRIDNNKGYEPGNVRWASRLEQANNRRTNSPLEYGGQVKTIAEWGRQTGLGKSRIIYRLSQGWSASRALTEPLKTSGASPGKAKLK